MNSMNLMTLAIGQLFHKHLDHCKDWEPATLLRWIEWFIVKKRYWTVVRDGEIAGAVLIRFVDTPGDCKSNYIDTGGRICFVDAAVAQGDGVLKELYTKMFNDMGHKADSMVWVRPKHNDRIISVSMEQAKRRLIKE